MLQRLGQLEQEALAALAEASSAEAVHAVRVRYLGRRGELTACLKALGQLPADERPQAGRRANEVKVRLEEAVARRLKAIEEAALAEALLTGPVDITLPGRRPPRGHLHPLTQVLDEAIAIFTSLNFTVAEGPEIETDWYCFEALNIPKDHPARDMQDTFYVADEVVLRTHTSSVQIRVMERHPPPVRIISPGKVYRCDADISHSPMFHQVEGLLVDEVGRVTFGDLKGLLELFAHRMFGPETAVRFRPSFFPYTEPSAEVDIQCVICHGGGCRLCKRTGWLEILGSGMVDPNVFAAVGYDPEGVVGFAFGMGVERIAMLKYGIDDIRLFFENDASFLAQF
ncbi:MAG: phenylalanine--tRNA ligase subunit alpha [Nitrospinota bacterium]